MPDTHNIFDSTTMSTILKWAIMILITGFIAQFGKQFATFIMGKIRNIRSKKDGGEPGAKAARPTPAAPVDAAEKARLKIEKKRAKAEAKERKKRS